jgi:hypothetical protein
MHEDILPEQQLEINSCPLHISIKSKRQTLSNGFALFKKTISQII